MRFRLIAGVLVIFTAGLLNAQSNATANSQTRSPSSQSDGPSKDKTETMVGVTKHTDNKYRFTAMDGKSWEVSNPDTLRGHEGRGIEVTGTFDAQGKIVRIEKVSNMACGPRFCERKCNGKCGNGSSCDCPKK
jgi:hypothetical protein